jgi:hypothetical protein
MPRFHPAPHLTDVHVHHDADADARIPRGPANRGKARL